MKNKIIIITILIAIVLISGCNQQPKQETVTCNFPYIQVGTSCCLDENDNGICDEDEQQAKPVPSEQIEAQSYCRFSFNSGIVCHDWKVTKDEVIMVVKDIITEAISIEDWNVGKCNEAKVIREDSSQSFEFSGCDNGNIGDKYEKEIIFIYNDGVSHKVEGEIKAIVESNGELEK